MSYDLHLVRPEPGQDPLAAAEASLKAQAGSEELNPGQPVPETEARKQAVAAALIALNPDLQVFQFDHAQLASLKKITAAEARIRYRHIELNGPEDGNGIQIQLFDDTASVTVPYWHAGEAARIVWKEIWSYLEVLDRDGGFATYDPQQERVLNLSRDFNGVVAKYGEGVSFLEQTAAELTQARALPKKRSWWKFW